MKSYLSILISASFLLSGCSFARTVITEKIVVYKADGTCKTTLTGKCQTKTVKQKFSNSDYQAKLKADNFATVQALSQDHQQKMAAYKQATACQAPSLQGVATEAAVTMAGAYRDCLLMNGGGRSDNIAEIVSAATGRSIDPSAQMYRSDNQLASNQDSNRTARSTATKRLIGQVLTSPIIYPLIWGDNPGNNSNGDSIGDGNTINITASTSGNQDDSFGGGAGGSGSGGEGGGGEGGLMTQTAAADTQTRNFNFSIFGNNDLLHATDSAQINPYTQTLTNNVSPSAIGQQSGGDSEKPIALEGDNAQTQDNDGGNSLL